MTRLAAGGVSAAVALAGCGGGRAHPAPAPVPPRAPATRAPVIEPDLESDDGVTVTTGKGHFEPAAVEAGLAPHRAALTRCYTERVGKRRWLGGHVLLHWDVAADGRFARVLLADSDLGAWPIEKCLLDIARGATFGVPVGGAAELTLPLEFSSKGLPATWDIEQSAKAVGGQLTKLATCAKAKPGVRVVPPDEVAITLYVGPHGRAQSVGFASATSPLDDVWATCAEQAALAWHLPDPKGQVTKLAVRYRPH